MLQQVEGLHIVRLGSSLQFLQADLALFVDLAGPPALRRGHLKNDDSIGKSHRHLSVFAGAFLG